MPDGATTIVDRIMMVGLALGVLLLLAAVAMNSMWGPMARDATLIAVASGAALVMAGIMAALVVLLRKEGPT